ncbi:MFS transporter [Amphibiibacter pelophylacis]|uniref:MFS transporter n=1 Tax=Amphibiibacter pelophylacis TaxID=1799477 RepID=A0ACC6P1A5_9BURK
MTHPSSSSAPATDPVAPRILLLVLASYLMIVLDISIIITGLPRIRESLGFTPAGLSWVHTAYTLTFGGLLMAGARAGDLFGRKPLFIGGLTVFVLASLMVGLATSPAMLIAGRALQGLGSAVLAPATLALLSVYFPEGPGRTRALGLYGATAGVGASAGMVLGGVLADLLSWRVGFFINAPIGLLLIAGALRWVPSPRNAPSTGHAGGRLDWLGALLSTLGMLALVYGLVEAAETGWQTAGSLLPLLAGVLLLAGFFVQESRAAQPLLPLRLLADRARSGAYLARMLYLAGVVGFWFYTTQYLQGVLGMRPLQAGLAFLPATGVQFVAAMMVSPLTRRFGHERLLAVGVAVTALGMAWLAGIGPDSGYFSHVALPMMVLGVGQGLSLSPLTVAGVAGVQPRDAGAASGLVNTAHQLGGSLGLAMLVVVFAASGHPDAAPAADLAHRVSTCLAVSAGLLGLALVVVLTMVRRPAPDGLLAVPAR